MSLLDRFRKPKHEVPPPVDAVCSVLFVCLGNICRSPTAEGVFAHLLEGCGLQHRVRVDSAGTYAGHAGEPPDARSREAAARRGVDLSRQRARRIAPEDLEHFDYVLAMDKDNREAILRLSDDPALRGKVRLLLEFAPHLPEREVPDPYYGGRGGFERVLDLIEEAAQGLLLEIRERYGI